MLHLHVHKNKAMNSVKYGSVLMSSGFSRYISEDTYFSLCKHTLEILSLLLKCNYYQPGNCMLYHQAIIHIFPVITKRCIMSIIFHFCCLIIVFFFFIHLCLSHSYMYMWMDPNLWISHLITASFFNQWISCHPNVVL